jgi:hypothetical protein
MEGWTGEKTKMAFQGRAEDSEAGKKGILAKVNQD